MVGGFGVEAFDGHLQRVVEGEFLADFAVGDRCGLGAGEAFAFGVCLVGGVAEVLEVVGGFARVGVDGRFEGRRDVAELRAGGFFDFRRPGCEGGPGREGEQGAEGEQGDQNSQSRR